MLNLTKPPTFSSSSISPSFFSKTFFSLFSMSDTEFLANTCAKVGGHKNENQEVKKGRLFACVSKQCLTHLVKLTFFIFILQTCVINGSIVLNLVLHCCSLEAFDFWNAGWQEGWLLVHLDGRVKLLPGGVQVQPGGFHFWPQSRVFLLRFLPKLKQGNPSQFWFSDGNPFDPYLLIVDLTTAIGLEVALQWTRLMGVMGWGCTILHKNYMIIWPFFTTIIK